MLKEAIYDNPTKFVNSKYSDIYDIIKIENVNIILIESDRQKGNKIDTVQVQQHIDIDVDDINYETDY